MTTTATAEQELGRYQQMLDAKPTGHFEDDWGTYQTRRLAWLDGRDFITAMRAVRKAQTDMGHPVHYRPYGSFHSECGKVPDNWESTIRDGHVTCDTCRWWRKTQKQYQY